MIPRTVHRIWLGGREPEWTAAFAGSWEQPGWTVEQWTEENVDGLFPLANQDTYDRAEEIAPDHVGQLRSDVLRYEILHRFGGVYVDADMECLRPLDELLDGVRCFAAWEEQYRWVGNTILGAAPGHPFMESLIEEIPESVRRNPGRRPNRITGPHLVTAQWRRNPFEVKLFDQRLFYPFGWREIAEHTSPGERPDAYAVHWWANMRREKGVPCPS